MFFPLSERLSFAPTQNNNKIIVLQYIFYPLHFLDGVHWLLKVLGKHVDANTLTPQILENATCQ